MKSVDEARLERDLEYRFQYLAEFIGFGKEDQAAIHGAACYLGPQIADLVDKTYTRLLAFDATARHFLPRQHGYDGPLPTPEQLGASHPQVQFRKEHLARYFTQILSRTYDGKMALYLDTVGKIHTPNAGNAAIDVPLVQMNALMGLLSDILIEAIAGFPLDTATQIRTIRAFQKLLWIQNDFITRHYALVSSAATARPVTP